MAELIPGVYDQLVDGWLAARTDELDSQRLRATLLDVDPAELADRVSNMRRIPSPSS